MIRYLRCITGTLILIGAVLTEPALGESQLSKAQDFAVVGHGETLSHIASRFYGDASLWPALYLENRDRIKDPTKIFVGQLLAVPPISQERRAEIRMDIRNLFLR